MRKLFILLIFLLITTSTFSQPQVIYVWEGPISGAIPNSNYVTVTDSNDNWIKSRMIASPTLDYYPADPAVSNGTSVIVCPGGGYWGVAIDHEGKKVAQWFNALGITAFVLKYRLPSDDIMTDKAIGPLQDAQEAIRLVRRNAKRFAIDPGKIGIMGFSAGGHLASTASTHFNEKVYTPSDTISARPDFSILIYPVISMDLSITHRGSRDNLLGKTPVKEQVDRFSNELQVGKQTPPAFLVHSLDDDVVPVENSIRYALAMRQQKNACELHIYEKGGHGYGLGRSEGTESTWPVACEKWLKSRGIITISNDDKE